MKKLVLYSHGKDSMPWGEKTQAFAAIAQRHDYAVVSPDYRTTLDPDARVQQLLGMNLSEYGEIVLVGSSMGAYVATIAAPVLKPKGLFLLAPAFYLLGYAQTTFNPPVDVTRVFHGWQDDIVPPANAWRFCQQYHIELKMLDTDHRMLSKLPVLVAEFERFLLGLA